MFSSINQSTFKVRKFFFAVFFLVSGLCCRCDNHFGQPHKSHYSNPFMNWKALTNGALFFFAGFCVCHCRNGWLLGDLCHFCVVCCQLAKCINFQFRREVEQTNKGGLKFCTYSWVLKKWWNSFLIKSNNSYFKNFFGRQVKSRTQISFQQK